MVQNRGVANMMFLCQQKCREKKTPSHPRNSSLANAYSSAKDGKKQAPNSSSDSGPVPCGLTGFVSVGFLWISWWTFRPWWWQLTHFSFLPRFLGRCSKLTTISQMGWKQQLIDLVGWWLVYHDHSSLLPWCFLIRSFIPSIYRFQKHHHGDMFHSGKIIITLSEKRAPFCFLGDLLGLNNYPVIRKFQSIIIRTPIKQPCSIIPGGPKTIK